MIEHTEDEYPTSVSPGCKLTVIIRNDAPMVFCGDSPSYRSVILTLTEEQLALLRLRYVGRSEGVDYYEEISKCFIEH